MSIEKAAIAALKMGFSVVPMGINEAKLPATKWRPLVRWTPLQKTAYTEAEAAKAFAGVKGLAVICGAVSGFLEVVDVDLKYDITGSLLDRLLIAIDLADPNLAEKLVIQQSQSGGVHFWYRCYELEGDKKLAMRPATDAELAAHNAKNPQNPLTDRYQLPLVLIETRGEGGLIMSNPTPKYSFVKGSPKELQWLSKAERDTLMEVCKSFDESKTAERKPAPAMQPKPTRIQPTSNALAIEDSPIDDFNARNRIVDVLYDFGWTVHRENHKDSRGDYGTTMLRPGATDHEYSAIAYPAKNFVVVFTSSATLPTESVGGKKAAHSPFAVYAWYRHGGDFKAAVKDLAAQGYGRPREQAQAQAKPKPAPQPERRPLVDVDEDGVVHLSASANTDANTDDDTDPREVNPYFRLLGFSKTDTGIQAFYYFVKHAKAVIRLTPQQMSKNNLMQLAPLAWWDELFGGERKKLHLDSAVNWLIQAGTMRGHFREKMVRGRGAWIDAGRTVIHVGDRLIVDGVDTPFDRLATKYIYESGEELNLSTENPLSADDAQKLLDVCELLNWERDVNAALLAGWCVIAPVCGALTWRPHLWLTGAAGTGKSWVFKNIVRRLLGATALDVQGNTSEGGLRQTLKCDAIPVIFDEAEAEDRGSQERMQLVLALMRAASSEDGGKILKGGKDGEAKQYSIRSCFAYASIAMQIQQQSDRSRITVLEFRTMSNDTLRKQRFEKLKALYNATFSDEWVQRFQARTIKMLPTILQNAATFNLVCQEVLGNQRTADQVSILLAAAFSLTSDGLASFEAAKAFVEKENWDAERGMNATKDELRLLAKIAETTVRVGVMERTIGELILCAALINTDSEVGDRTANDTLKRCGIKVVHTTITPEDPFAERRVVREVVISDSADWLKKTLRDTPWANDHRNLIKRLAGARELPSVRFAAGVINRAIAIPITHFSEEEQM